LQSAFSAPVVGRTIGRTYHLKITRSTGSFSPALKLYDGMRWDPPGPDMGAVIQPEALEIRSQVIV